MQSYHKTLYKTQKQKQLLMKATLMMYLNQSMVLLYQKHKTLWGKVQVELLIQSYIILLIFKV